MSNPEVNPKLEFVKTLEILATKLTKTEYERVTSTMYSLYAGISYGFDQAADPYLLPTIRKIWEDTREKRLTNLATVKRKFVVYDGQKKS
jgi:hypothetical protein